MVLRSVVRKVAHPKYNDFQPLYDYDVGVVQVKTPFDMSAVERPIALVKVGEEAAAGEQAVTTGYGHSRVSTFFFALIIQCKSSFTELSKKSPVNFSSFTIVFNVTHTSLE